MAACENDALVVVDPLTSKVIAKQERVHSKHCNTITFIDNRLFATCSDDSNISVWDVRNLKEVCCKFLNYVYQKYISGNHGYAWPRTSNMLCKKNQTLKHIKDVTEKPPCSLLELCHFLILFIQNI